MSSQKRVCGVIGLLAMVVGAAPAFGSFHLMQIEQVIGGVNGDTSAQAIQLRMRQGGQQFVSQAQVCLENAAGMNPILIVDMETDVTFSTRVLIASANFPSKTTPMAVPNFTMTNLIPPSHFAAGTLTFRQDSVTPCTGGIYWRLSWGGGGYTGLGSVIAAPFGNDADGNANPPFAGSLPSTSLQALQFTGTAGALSTNNAAQYSITSGAAVFTNNAGTNYTVTGPTGACCDDNTGVCMNGVTQTTCEAGSDRYGGDGSTCAAINPPCTGPTGACCDEDTGICTEAQTQTACAGAGDRYGGDNSTCATINPSCTAPTGACCDDDTGFCADGVTNAACPDRWGGAGSTCATINPACVPPPPPPPIQIALEVVAGSAQTAGPGTLSSPLQVTHAGDGRLFIVDQIGQIRVIVGGALEATPFLDISGKLPMPLGSFFDERGLLGLAFHPNYAADEPNVGRGRFFVRYSAPRAGDPTEPCNAPCGFIVGCHKEILAEYHVLGDPLTSNVADPSSEIILFSVDKPEFNHDGGHVAFGPDGLLYFSLGDGGGANDDLHLNGVCDAGYCSGVSSTCTCLPPPCSVSAQNCPDSSPCVSCSGLCNYEVGNADAGYCSGDSSTCCAGVCSVSAPNCVDSSSCVSCSGPCSVGQGTCGDGSTCVASGGPPPHGPIGNAQNINAALGKMHRVDVDSGSPYAIPLDNPFAGATPGLDEIYAYGLRNPYRWSFDRGTGDLYLGDAGQDVFEEVDIIDLGENYGWAAREGAHFFDPFNTGTPPASCHSIFFDAGIDCGPLSLIDPVSEYTHAEGGTAVIGGYVYRGAAYPQLQGIYVYGDFTSDFFVPAGHLYYFDLTGPEEFVRQEFFIAPNGDPFGKFLKGFGEDEDGEVYVCASDTLGPYGTDGVVYKIVPPPANVPVWDPAKKSCTNSGADPTKACTVDADCGICTLKKCSGLPANSTCTGSGTTGTCPLKQCSGLPANTTCTGTGQGTCPTGQTCDFTGQTCDFVNCITTAGECTPVSAGMCTAGPPGVCLPWPNNNPQATTRSLRFTVEGPAGPSKPEAIKVTMVDLQHPKPPNVPLQAPTNMTTYDTRMNAVCVGGTHPGHHCDTAADCPGAGSSCPSPVACTADPACTDPLKCTPPSNSCARWVGKNGTFYEAQGPPPSGPYKAARLQCTPFYDDWKTKGLITVVGGDIAPSSEYSVEVYGASCMGAEATCTIPNVSAPVTMYTRRSGDVGVPFNPPSSDAQPNVTDVVQLVNKVKSLAGAPVKAISQLQPNLPEMNTNINVSDIVAVVDAVRLFKYAYSGPCPCPSLSACGALMCGSDTVCRNSGLQGLGAGAVCVKTCTGPTGPLAGEPCIDNTHCVGSGTCGAGFCRDRCGRCTPP